MKLLMAMFISLSTIGIDAQQINNFQLKDVDNQTRLFNELKGEKLTIIDFWASWCKPCMKAIPELNMLYDNYKDNGIQVIGINCDGPRSISKVSPLVKSMQIKYPVLLDINSDIMSDLNLSAFPTLIIVNQNNDIVWIHEGFVTGDIDIIKEEIEKQLKKLTE